MSQKKIKKITGNRVDPVFWLSPVTMSDPLSVSNSKGRSPAGKSERLSGKGLWICAKSRALAVATGSLPDPETKHAEGRTRPDRDDNTDVGPSLPLTFDSLKILSVYS